MSNDRHISNSSCLSKFSSTARGRGTAEAWHWLMEFAKCQYLWQRISKSMWSNNSKSWELALPKSAPNLSPGTPIVSSFAAHHGDIWSKNKLFKIKIVTMFALFVSPTLVFLFLRKYQETISDIMIFHADVLYHTSTKHVIFLLQSHNAITHWTKVVIISCYHLLLNPTSNLSHDPTNTLFCFVGSDSKDFTKQVLLLKAWHTVKLWFHSSFPFSFFRSRVPVSLEDSTPCPIHASPCSQQTRTQEWALPGCIILDLSIQAAPKAGGKVAFNWERGISGSAPPTWR